MLSWLGPDLLLMIRSARRLGQTLATGALAISGLSNARGAMACASARRRCRLRPRKSSSRSTAAIRRAAFRRALDEFDKLRVGLRPILLPDYDGRSHWLDTPATGRLATIALRLDPRGTDHA